MGARDLPSPRRCDEDRHDSPLYRGPARFARQSNNWKPEKKYIYIYRVDAPFVTTVLMVAIFPITFFKSLFFHIFVSILG